MLNYPDSVDLAMPFIDRSACMPFSPHSTPRDHIFCGLVLVVFMKVLGLGIVAASQACGITVILVSLYECMFSFVSPLGMLHAFCLSLSLASSVHFRALVLTIMHSHSATISASPSQSALLEKHYVATAKRTR